MTGWGTGKDIHLLLIVPYLYRYLQYIYSISNVYPGEGRRDSPLLLLVGLNSKPL